MIGKRRRESRSLLSSMVITQRPLRTPKSCGETPRTSVTPFPKGANILLKGISLSELYALMMAMNPFPCLVNSVEDQPNQANKHISRSELNYD